MGTVEWLAVFGSLVYVIQTWLSSWDGENMGRTRISYWVLTTEGAWMEVSPAEITQLWSDGYRFAIRIERERTSK